MTDSVGDEPVLSVSSPREYRVVVFLSAEEYVALTHLCERDGLKQSSYIRMLLCQRMQQAADAAHDAGSARGPPST